MTDNNPMYFGICSGIIPLSGQVAWRFLWQVWPYMLAHLWHVDIFPDQSDASCLCLLGCMDFAEPSQISSTFLASGQNRLLEGNTPATLVAECWGNGARRVQNWNQLKYLPRHRSWGGGCLKLSSCNSTQFNHHGRCEVSFHKALLVLVVLSDFLVGHITVLIGCIAIDLLKSNVWRCNSKLLIIFVALISDLNLLSNNNSNNIGIKTDIYRVPFLLRNKNVFAC